MPSYWAFFLVGIQIAVVSCDTLLRISPRPDLLVAPRTTGCAESVNLTVYYETGCPDSNDFFTKVLIPNYDSFKHVLTGDYIPYGNAQKFSSSYYGDTWACQHGFEELRGNIFQACGRELLSHKKFQDLVFCMMGTGDVSTTYKSWEYCTAAHNIDYDTLYDCYDGRDGTKQMQEMESLSADNGHTYIPWLSLNGNMNSTVQSMGLKPLGFTKLMCATLCEDVRPTVCGNFNYN